MHNQSLNIVYIGPQSFPLGGATSKRRRNMVEYMNCHNIQSHYLVTTFGRRNNQNKFMGSYGRCTYFDLSQCASIPLLQYYSIGISKLKEWYNTDKKNILLFHTLVSWNEWPFYKYAKNIGYIIVFDQVETSYLLNDTGSFFFSLQVRFSEFLSNIAYRTSPAFVISTALLKENADKFPKRKLCILPNSTPEIQSNPKSTFSEPLLLLYSGTYSPKDGVSYLIDGVILAHEYGIDCKLILLGKGTERDMKVLEKAKGKDYIEYRGFVSDEKLERTMKDCDVLCMTRINSRFATYGFPFKLSEYLATGNILLATSVGDVNNYVRNKESAIVVEPENSLAIADAIRYIKENPEESLKIAKAGHQVMMETFSIEKIGQKFISFLESV